MVKAPKDKVGASPLKSLNSIENRPHKMMLSNRFQQK